MSKKIDSFINSHQKICLNLRGLVLIMAVFMISLGQLQRIQLARTVAFYGHDLFIAIFIILSTLNLGKNLTSFQSIISRWRYLLIFLLWSAISLIINQNQSGFNIIPWLYLSRLITYLLFAFFTNVFLSQVRCFRKWWRALFFLIVISFLIVGFFQYLLIPDLRFLAPSGWDVHYFRWAGAMLDPNFSGMILVNLLLVWLLAFKSSCKKKLYLGLILIVALALTYSRSAYLAFGTVVLIILALPKQMFVISKKVFIFLLLSLIVMIPLLPKPGGLGVELRRTETITSRVQVNETAMSQLSLQQLLIGKGIFTPSINTDIKDQVIHAHFPDNLLVFLLTTTGLPGLLLAAIFITSELKKAYVEKRVTSIVLITGTLVHSMFNLTLLEPINLLILLLCLNWDNLSMNEN
ncbi:MAG: hypothetical protein XD95_0143 [Microgenomates bacterium 39_7]|nr:MAG: hypothetical protein XD95_0143 [Microgenomates bacterium 39_7]